MTVKLLAMTGRWFFVTLLLRRGGGLLSKNRIPVVFWNSKGREYFVPMIKVVIDRDVARKVVAYCRWFPQVYTSTWMISAFIGNIICIDLLTRAKWSGRIWHFDFDCEESRRIIAISGARFYHCKRRKERRQDLELYATVQRCRTEAYVVLAAYVRRSLVKSNSKEQQVVLVRVYFFVQTIRTCCVLAYACMCNAKSAQGLRLFWVAAGTVSQLHVRDLKKCSPPLTCSENFRFGPVEPILYKSTRKNCICCDPDPQEVPKRKQNQGTMGACTRSHDPWGKTEAWTIACANVDRISCNPLCLSTRISCVQILQ
jgi:hypothetical protein